MSRICRDSAGSAWDIEYKMCDALGAWMGNVLGPTEGDARESVGDL